jgi:PAS domain S-box-containing protein
MSDSATVLVVDDVAANRLTLRELLEPDDYHIIEAANGPSALRLARDTPPDLVLLDVMMPGMNGFEVCHRLRADKILAEVPVIIVTALDDKASRLAGLEAGADDFITKPFNGMELRARARTITRLNRYRRLHEVQQALRESELHFRALFDTGPVAVYSCDVAGNIQDFNGRAAKLWGRDLHDGNGADRFCGSLKMYRPDGTVVPRDKSRMADVCLGNIPSVEDEEFLVERPDGTRASVAAFIAPIKNDFSEITGAIGIFQDITTRKAAEHALRESEQWLKAIFDQAAVGVVQTDAKTRRFVRFNQRFCDFLGYSREEMEELSHSKITFEHDIAPDLDRIEQLQSRTLNECVWEKRYVRKDGTLVWASVAASALGTPEKEPTAFIAVVLDITERKRLDEHFMQAQKMEALGQFSGGVAHDFNNILAAIGGYTELSRLILRDNPDVHEHLGQVLKATGRAADLVRQILTFSRQEPQVRRAIQLQAVVEESVELMRSSIPSTIVIDTSLTPGLPTVLANANQIHQVLMNLGINAWHSMRDRPGRLEVKLEPFTITPEYAATTAHLRAGNYVRLSVSDTGCGMDPATLRRIFDPFFTTKAPGDGTGLGLSVVHGIMDSHDGAVTVHSQPGEGTVFRLYFPQHDGETIPSVADEGPVPRGNGQELLIVDDEEVLTLLIQKTLDNLGYKSGYTTNPLDALELVRADPERYKLILSDQTMPGMTGLNLALQLKEIAPELPIILMTGYSLSLTAERIAEAGVRQLIPKPVTIKSLGNAVHSAISGRAVAKSDTNSPY